MSAERNRRRAEGRRFGVAALLAATLAALAIGIVVGYIARGEPDPGSPVTVQDELPAVTVTVPAAP